MKCPYCNKEMELGYIQSRDGLNWSPKKLLIPVFAPLKKGSVSLANDAAEYSGCIHAHKCGDCKKVIIDYSKK